MVPIIVDSTVAVHGTMHSCPLISNTLSGGIDTFISEVNLWNFPMHAPQHKFVTEHLRKILSYTGVSTHQ